MAIYQHARTGIKEKTVRLLNGLYVIKNDIFLFCSAQIIQLSSACYGDTQHNKKNADKFIHVHTFPKQKSREQKDKNKTKACKRIGKTDIEFRHRCHPKKSGKKRRYKP